MRYLLLATLCLSTLAYGSELSRRKAVLEEIRETLPPVSSFEQWLTESGELPPDFSRMPSIPELPPLLTDAEGREITSPEAWEKTFAPWVLPGDNGDAAWEEADGD